jgi:hypothetical protein
VGTAECLQERLEEMAIFELNKDGEIVHHSLTIRGLYKYVLECITKKPLEQAMEKQGSLSSPILNNSLPAETVLPPFEPRSPTQFAEKSSAAAHVRNKKSGKVTYHERLGGYLHPRDMRRLVTPMSASNEPELIVRRHVMLFNFTPVRVM